MGRATALNWLPRDAPPCLIIVVLAGKQKKPRGGLYFCALPLLTTLSNLLIKLAAINVSIIYNNAAELKGSNGRKL